MYEIIGIIHKCLLPSLSSDFESICEKSYWRITTCWLNRCTVVIYVCILVIRVRFAQNQFTGSETAGFVLVNLEVIGGSSADPFTVMVTPSEQSPVSAEGNSV